MTAYAPANGESGQAMAEYAIIVSAFLGVLLVGGSFFVPDFIDALQLYLDNLYRMINLPVP